MTMTVYICSNGDIIFKLSEYSATVIYFNECTDIIGTFTRRTTNTIDVIVENRTIIKDEL